MTCCLALALLAALPPLVPRSSSAESRDLRRLQGEWEVMSEEQGGVVRLPGQPGFPQNLRVAFQGDTVRFFYPGRPAHLEATCRLDAAARPRRLRTNVHGGPVKGQTLRYVYELRGGTLRIGYRPGGREWPPAVAAPAGSSGQVLTFRRVRNGPAAGPP
jgi:uncharacterized protein (TIGR03067 family)